MAIPMGPMGPPSQLPTNPLAMQGPPSQLPTAPMAGIMPPQQQQSPMAGLLGNQSALTDATMNPLFNVGMGLLAHRYDRRINPFQAALGGLQTAKKYQTAGAKEKRMEELRKEMLEFLRKQGAPNAEEQAKMAMNMFSATPQDRDRLRTFMGYDPLAGYGETATQPGMAEPGRSYYLGGWEDVLGG